MDAYISILTDRENFDRELAEVRSAVSDLRITIPLDIRISKPTIGRPKPPSGEAAQRRSFGDSAAEVERAWQEAVKIADGLGGISVNRILDNVPEAAYTGGFFGSGRAAVASASKGFFGRIASGVKSTAKLGTRLVPGIGTAISAGMLLGEANQLRDELPRMESSYWDSLGAGLDDMIDETLKLNRGIAEGFRDEAGIFSPARVPAEIGAKFTEAIGAGLQSSSPQVSQRMRQLVRQSFASASVQKNTDVLTVKNKYRNVPPEVREEIQRGIETAMRFMRIQKGVA